MEEVGGEEGEAAAASVEWDVVLVGKRPTRLPAAEIVSFDNLVMLGVSGLLVLFAATGLRIARWEGGVLLAAYVGDIALLGP